MTRNVLHSSRFAIALGIAAFGSLPASASPILSVFSDPAWIEFQVSDNPGQPEDHVGAGGYVSPGWGVLVYYHSLSDAAEPGARWVTDQ